VQRVLSLITQQLGPDVMVAVKAVMAPQGSERSLIEGDQSGGALVARVVSQIRWCFFEPDEVD
jgi:hypothetical protein